VSTAIVSDLHIGLQSRNDLVRRQPVLDALLGALAGADDVVLLGDVVELRERPAAQVMADALPVLRRIGEATAGKRITIVPGNHDHFLARSLIDGAERLDLETSGPPPSNGPLAAIAEALGGDRVRLAYPGTWVRPDVYATHGHYLDVHNTVPSFERLAIGLSGRITGATPDGRRLTPDDYEAAVGPVYALTYALAQSSRGTKPVTGGAASVRMWRMANGNSSGRLPRLLLNRLAIPAAIGTLNKAGLGPLKPDLTAVELRRAALAGMHEVIGRLGINAGHVIFGHTHRSGPHPGDEGWGALMNTGSWNHEPAFLGREPRKSPYWPGHVAIVPDDGPPELVSTLDELPV
jgi:hypothetical protein